MNCRANSSVSTSIWLWPLVCWACAASALECPAPPVQSHKDWDTEVSVEVAKIGMVKGAELHTRVRSATQDLMGHLPGADRVYLEQMMFSAYCSAVRDATNVSEGDKANQILAYRRELTASLHR